MTVDEFIETIENEHLEKALKTLAKDPETLIKVYLGAKEFQRAKLTRANFVPDPEEEEKVIKIQIND